MKQHDDTSELYEVAIDPENAEQLHRLYAPTLAKAARVLLGKMPPDADQRLMAMDDLQGMLEWLEAEREVLTDALAKLRRSPSLNLV